MEAIEDSKITLDGGVIGNQLYARGNSRVDIFDGEIQNALRAFDNSSVFIYGGTIANFIEAGNSSDDTSTITLAGSDFAVNGISVPYGEYDALDWTNGTLSGTLSNNDYLDVLFYIKGNSKIILIPEPASFLLLAFGAMILKRRYK